MKNFFLILVLAVGVTSFNLSFSDEKKENAFEGNNVSERGNDSENILRQFRTEMVERQIKSRGVRTPKVIEAMSRVERHLFISPKMWHMAYNDHPLPIGYGQTISQPYIVAYMTESLELERDDRVLEIGTGSGYQAAVLAEIVKEVYTIEIIEPLALEARERLRSMGYENVYVKHGDGYKGWPEQSPFDAIIVTAAPPKMPELLIEQLKIGGRMVVPVGSFSQELYLVTKNATGVDKKKLIPVVFVPMVKGEK